MNNTTVLYSTNWFDVVEVKTQESAMMVGLKPKGQNVAVIPYTIENGIISKIGVRYECNPLRINNYSYTAITGGVEPNELSALNAAKRELFEESGYSVNDSNLWRFLGMLTTSKLIQAEQSCYAVNITNIKQKSIPGDGTVNEKLSKFELVPIGDMLKEKDGILLSLILKLYYYSYNHIFTNF